MAYVAITGDLLNRVQGRITVMKKREIEADCPGLEAVHTLDASDLHNLANWGAANLHLMPQIPNEWMSKREEADIVVTGAVQLDNVPDPVNVKKSVRFKGLTNAFARPSPDYWSRSDCVIHINDLRALPDDMVGRNELVHQFEMACTEAQIIARWEKVNSDIQAFLRKCKSLNEAIKLFPAVKMYLHDGDIRRVEAKVQRGPRAEIVSDLDTGAITAAAIAAQLSEAVQS